MLIKFKKIQFNLEAGEFQLNRVILLIKQNKKKLIREVLNSFHRADLINEKFQNYCIQSYFSSNQTALYCIFHLVGILRYEKEQI